METIGKETKEAMSRRVFLGGAGLAAAVGSAALLTGCSSNSSDTDAVDSSAGYEWEDEADVIVIGAGTGLCAAMEAVNAGAQVIVLEKQARMGGDTSLSEGIIYAGGTSVQEKAGVIDERTGSADTVEATINDWLTHAAEGVNVELATKMLENGSTVIDWFVSKGVEFELYQSGAEPVKRGHRASTWSGDELTGILVEELKALGAKLYTESRVTEILTDQNDAIIGVKVKESDGTIKRYGGKAVILSTGGTADNTDLTMQYNPEAINWINLGAPHSMGEGFFLAEKFNAARVGQLSWLDETYPNPALLGVMGEGGPIVMELMITYPEELAKSGPRPMIFLNSNGQRFVDETLGYNKNIGVKIAASEDSFCWNIFDKNLWTVDAGLFEGFLMRQGVTRRMLLKNDTLKEAFTLDELAAETNLNPVALSESVDRWNSLVSSGLDTDFNRPENTLYKIAAPPFYAYKIKPATTVPLLGARISLNLDEDCRVLNTKAEPIPGLYAVGTGMTLHPVCGRGYPGSGASLAAGFGAGSIAGSHAAAFAL